jgi:predicted RND superfamily exporter protein
MRPSFFARRSFAIVLIVVFLLPFIWMGTRRAIRGNRNDVREWLPDGFSQSADYRWFQEHFPHEQFVLVSWVGCTLNDPRLELFARKLVPPKSDAPAEPAPEVEEESTWRRFWPVPKPPKPVGFKAALTGQRLVQDLQNRYEDLTEEEIIERLEGSLIGPDHLKTCLVVTLNPQTEGTSLRATVEKIRRVAEECNIKADEKKWSVAEREIRLGGPPVDNVAIDVEGERTLYRLAGLSAIIGLTISMICFHSVRLTSMVFWVAILSAGVGLAIVYWSGGTADAILMTMPSLLYVLAISGAIHIVNYYHDAIHEGGGLEGAPGLAIKHAAGPCTVAAFTTALGLGSLIASHIIPISKFGVFSAIGVMATLLLLFFYLPALLHYFPSRAYAEKHAGKHHQDEKDSLIHRWWQMVGRFVVRHNIMVSGACVAVMVFFGFGVNYMETSVKLMKFFSPSAEIIGHYGWLEEQLGPLVPMEVVVKFDNQANHLSMVERMRIAEDVERAVEQLDSVGGALSAATFAPNIDPDKRKSILGGINRAARDGVLNRRLEPHRDEFRDYLAYDFAKADALLATHDPTLDELGIPQELAAPLAERKLDTLKKIEAYGEIQYLKGVGPEGAAQVTEAIRNWRIAHGEELWRVCARVDALTDLDYAEFLPELADVVEPVLEHYRQQGVTGVEGVYTGMVPLIYQAQHELMKGLYNSLAWAFVLIAVVMIFVLRSASAGLLAMIPNLFPVVIVFGLLGWLRLVAARMGWTPILVDVGSMMTASVALGVAVDDTIHYLTWYRRGLDRGLDRNGAVMLAYQRCATAMTQTTLIAGFGLAAFCFSTFTPTQRFGTLMLVILFAALLGDLIFLPALLTSPLGRFFRTRRKRPASEPAQEAEPQAPAGRDLVGTSAGGPHAQARQRTDGPHSRKPARSGEGKAP